MVDFTTLVLISAFFFFLWLPQAIQQILTWTYWWQVKEYRFDRFWVFLKTSDGREKLGLNRILLKFLSLIVVNIYPPIPLFVFLYTDLIVLYDMLKKTVRQPVVTERVKKIWFTSFVGLVITYFSFYFLLFNSLILGELLLIVTPYFGILWTIPIVNKVKRKEIAKAKLTLKSVKPTVIGITGSYGKTTTKEFIYHFLSQKFKTAKTDGSENTEFGIARKTYKNVLKGTRFFVVEMGAYKRGEIQRLANIVDPDVGIITGIEEQHLSLFGSFENIKKAKFELIDALPVNGVSVFNLSNIHCRELADLARKLNKKLKVLTYYVQKSGDNDKKMKADIIAEIIFIDVDRVKFRVLYEGEEKILTAPVHGTGFVENLICGILIARYFGVVWEDIENGCKTIVMPENTMNTYKLKTGVTIIDDTHNSTPLAFESALSYLANFKGDKVVITSGIIELGVKSVPTHQKLGKLMKVGVDKIVLTNSDFIESIKSGLGNSSHKLYFAKGDKLISEITKIIKTSQNVVLLEGRFPSKIMEVIQSYK